MKGATLALGTFSDLTPAGCLLARLISSNGSSLSAIWGMQHKQSVFTLWIKCSNNKGYYIIFSRNITDAPPPVHRPLSLSLQKHSLWWVSVAWRQHASDTQGAEEYVDSSWEYQQLAAFPVVKTMRDGGEFLLQEKITGGNILFNITWILFFCTWGL